MAWTAGRSVLLGLPAVVKGNFEDIYSGGKSCITAEEGVQPSSP